MTTVSDGWVVSAVLAVLLVIALILAWPMLDTAAVVALLIVATSAGIGILCHIIGQRICHRLDRNHEQQRQNQQQAQRIEALLRSRDLWPDGEYTRMRGLRSVK